MNLTRFEDIKDGMPVFMPSGIQARLFLEDDNIIVQYPELHRDKYTKEDFQKLIDEGIMIFHDVTIPQQSALMEKLATKGYIREGLVNVLNEAFEQEDNKPGDVYTALKDKEENKEYVTPEFKNELLTCLTKICKEYPIVKVRQQALTFIDELGLQEYYDIKAVKDFINKYTDLLCPHVNESLNEVKEITRDEWNKTPDDYKMIKNGKPYLVYLDNETHATVLGPCKIIDESLNEENPKAYEKGQYIKGYDQDGNLITGKIVSGPINDVDGHFQPTGRFLYTVFIANEPGGHIGSERHIFEDNIIEIIPSPEKIQQDLDSVTEYTFDVKYEDTQANEWGDAFTSGTLTITKWSDGTYSWYADDIDDGGDGFKSITQCKKAYKDYLKEGGFRKIVITQNESLNQEDFRAEANAFLWDACADLAYQKIEELAKSYPTVDEILQDDEDLSIEGEAKEYAQEILDMYNRGYNESLNEEQGPYYGSEALGNIAIEIENGNKQGVEPTEFGNWVLHTSMDEKWEQLTNEAQLFILEKIAMPVADGHISYDDLEIYVSNAGSLTREDILSMNLFDEEQIDSMLNGKEEMFLLSYELQFDGNLEVGESFKQKDKKKKKQKIEDSMNEETINELSDKIISNSLKKLAKRAQEKEENGDMEGASEDTKQFNRIQNKWAKLRDMGLAKGKVESVNEGEGAGVYVKDKNGDITGPYLNNETAQDYIKQMVEQGNKEEDFKILTDNGENEMQETVMVQEAFKVYNTTYGEVKEQGTFNNWNEVQNYLDQEWGKYNVDMVKENPTFGSQLDKENFMGNYNVEIVEVPVTLDKNTIKLVEPEKAEIEGADSNKGEKSMLAPEEKPALEQPEIKVCAKCDKTACECNSGEPIEDPKEIEEPKEEQMEEDLIELGSVLKDETEEGKDETDPATELLNNIDCEGEECVCEPCPDCENIPCDCEKEIIDNPEEAIEKVDDVEEIIDDIEDYIKTLLDAEDDVEVEIIDPVQECSDKKEEHEEEEKNEDFQDNMGMLTDVNDMDLPDALADTIDTKEDGSLYKIGDLAKELEELKSIFKSEIENIKNDIKSALQDVKQDIKMDVNNVENKVNDTKTAVDDLTVEEEEPVEEEPAEEEEIQNEEPIEAGEDMEESMGEVNPIAEAIEKTLKTKMSKTTFYNKLNENYGYNCLSESNISLKMMVDGYVKANKLNKYIIDESSEQEQAEETKYLNNKYLRKGKLENLEDAKKKIDQYTSQNKSSEDIKNAITLLSDNDQEKEEATDYAVEKMKESLLKTSQTSKLLNLSTGSGIGYKK